MKLDMCGLKIRWTKSHAVAIFIPGIRQFIMSYSEDEAKSDEQSPLSPNCIQSQGQGHMSVGCIQSGD